LKQFVYKHLICDLLVKAVSWWSLRHSTSKFWCWRRMQVCDW